MSREDKGAWQDGSITLEGFQLEQGGVLPSVDIAYVAQGRLNATKSNAILVLHGYTSSHKFVCGNAQNNAEGSWAQLVGPGKAIDTNHYFVIAPNALGSCFGSTGPSSIAPNTGRPYGPDFPDVTFKDIVETQYRLVRQLGVNKLVAVTGVSMGGFATWQWGVQYPEFVDGLVVVLSSLNGRNVAPKHGHGLLHELQNDAHWNGGWIYDDDRIRPALQRLRKATLLAYGIKPTSQSNTPPTAADQRIEELATKWACEFDPNSLSVLGDAMRSFDVTPLLSKLTAKVFFLLATTDRLFPAAQAGETLDALRENAVKYQYLALETEYGHQASGAEWEKWEQPLRDFLISITPSMRSAVTKV